jgi:uracil-DNA glycosylase family 4
MVDLVLSSYQGCQRCALASQPHAPRTNVVFGNGNPDADLLIVLDAPTPEEDAAGYMPEGVHRGFLDDFLSRFDYVDEPNRVFQDVFVTTLMGCRPMRSPRVTRAPKKSEVNACRPRIDAIIESVDPYVILLLGKSCLKYLTEEPRSLSKVAEDIAYPRLEVITRGVFGDVRRTAFATYGPEHLMQRSPNGSDSPFRHALEVWGRAFDTMDMMRKRFRGEALPHRRHREGE